MGQPEHGGGDGGDGPRRDGDPGQGDADRRAPIGGRRGGRRARRWPVPRRRRSRPGGHVAGRRHDRVRAHARPPGGRGPGPGGDRDVRRPGRGRRAPGGRTDEREPHVRQRERGRGDEGRSRDRCCRGPRLRRRSRLRDAGQPGDRGRAGARRGRPGAGRSAPGGPALRRERGTAGGVVHGLPAAVGDGGPDHRRGALRIAVAVHRVRRQGRRRGRRDRSGGGGGGTSCGSASGRASSSARAAGARRGCRPVRGSGPTRTPTRAGPGR